MIFIFSNIKASPTKANELSESIKPTDTLVFLNKAVNFEFFMKTPATKVLICAIKGDDNKLLERYPDITMEERKKLYFCRDEWYGREDEIFDQFILRNKLEEETKFFYPKGKKPTTGFLAYQFYKANGVVLVSFFPNKDFSTTHWEGHDFRYEQDALDWDEVKILDLR